MRLKSRVSVKWRTSRWIYHCWDQIEARVLIELCSWFDSDLTTDVGIRNWNCAALCAANWVQIRMEWPGAWLKFDLGTFMSDNVSIFLSPSSRDQVQSSEKLWNWILGAENMGDEAMPNFRLQKGGFQNRALVRESLNWSRGKGDKGTFFGSLQPQRRPAPASRQSRNHSESPQQIKRFHGGQMLPSMQKTKKTLLY